MANKKGKAKETSAEGADLASPGTKTGNNPASDPVQQEMYELKLKDLLEKLDRAKSKAKTLQDENEKLIQLQRKSVSEKQDIIEYLRIELENHESILTKTETSMKQQQACASEEIRAQVESKRAIEQIMQVEHETLKKKVNEMSTDAEQVRQFKENKHVLESAVEKLSNELASTELAFKSEVHELEKKFILDKQAYCRDIGAQLVSAVTKFRTICESGVAASVQEAMRENVVMRTEAVHIDAQVQLVVGENAMLEEQCKRLKAEVQMALELQRGLAAKNVKAYKLIRVLMEQQLHGDKPGKHGRTCSPVQKLSKSIDPSWSQRTCQATPKRGSHLSSVPVSAIESASDTKTPNTPEINKPVGHHAMHLSNALCALASELEQVYKTPNTMNTLRSISPPERYGVPQIVRAFTNDLKMRRVSVRLKSARTGNISHGVPLPNADVASATKRGRFRKHYHSPNISIDVILPHLSP